MDFAARRVTVAMTVLFVRHCGCYDAFGVKDAILLHILGGAERYKYSLSVELSNHIGYKYLLQVVLKEGTGVTVTEGGDQSISVCTDICVITKVDEHTCLLGELGYLAVGLSAIQNDIAGHQVIACKLFNS